MQRDIEQIKASGLNVVGLSNDSQKILARFGKQGSIEYTLLSDPDSKVIRQFEVLNDSVKKGNKKYGIAHPVTIVLNSDATVAAKINSTVRERHATGQLVEAWSKVAPAKEMAETETAAVPAALDFEVKDIEGENVQLSGYAGKVVVIVNTASRCGFTPQYKSLQKLYADHKADGLEILAFPCNQFNGQEPGSEAEIKTFCKDNYAVEFGMFSKVDVKGDKQAPLFKHLTSQETKMAKAGDVKWNFEKFVLDRNGKVVARFSSQTAPDSDEFKQLIAKLLKSEG